MLISLQQRHKINTMTMFLEKKVLTNNKINNNKFPAQHKTTIINS